LSETSGLLILYTRAVTKDDISSREDVDEWLHKSSVYPPGVTAEIDLLIVNDVRGVLEPLEVKNSED